MSEEGRADDVADARQTFDALHRHGQGDTALRYWAFFERRSEPVLTKFHDPQWHAYLG